jgi:membrane protein implicated in regulation of membrane protease activity
MLIIALVLAVIGLAALVTAVVTSNELIAWVCIAASVVGVVLLILDALRERQRREPGGDEVQESDEAPAGEGEYVDYPEEIPGEGEAAATKETPQTEESTVAADRRGDEPAK